MKKSSCITIKIKSQDNLAATSTLKIYIPLLKNPPCKFIYTVRREGERKRENVVGGQDGNEPTKLFRVWRSNRRVPIHPRCRHDYTLTHMHDNRVQTHELVEGLTFSLSLSYSQGSSCLVNVTVPRRVYRR